MHREMETTACFIELWLFYARHSKKMHHSLEDLFLLAYMEVMEGAQEATSSVHPARSP